MGRPDQAPLETLEENGMVENSGLQVEIQFLRQELKLRILLQNLLLQALTVIFAVLAAISALSPPATSALCFIFQCVMLAAILQWCHHGVRTAQIKEFLQELNQEGARGKWETWLPAHRPATLLGSRWMVSTKGVFLGLGAMMMLLAVIVAPEINYVLLLTSSVIWAIGTIFLFTNPKE